MTALFFFFFLKNSSDHVLVERYPRRVTFNLVTAIQTFETERIVPKA